MKRIFIRTLLSLALLATMFAAFGSAQTRGGRKAPPAQGRPAQAKPTPAPTPTPTPVSTIAETPLPPGQRARFDVNNYRIVAELNPSQHLLTASAESVWLKILFIF